MEYTLKTNIFSLNKKLLNLILDLVATNPIQICTTHNIFDGEKLLNRKDSVEKLVKRKIVQPKVRTSIDLSHYM